MTKPINLYSFEEENPAEELKEEPQFEVKAGSRGHSTSGLSTTIQGKLMSPIPMNPAEMARMLALGKTKFAVYEVMVSDLIQEAQSITVDSEQTNKQVSELGLRSKKLGKEIKDRRDGFTKFAKDFEKGMASFTKPFLEACERVEAITKNKVKDWLQLKELERRKQEKLLQDAQKEVQKKVDAEAKAAGVETVQIQPAIVKQEEKTVTRVESGSVHLTHFKDWKLVNLSLVPREILQRAVERLKEDRQRDFLGPVINEEIKRNPEVQIDGIMIFDSAKPVFRN